MAKCFVCRCEYSEDKLIRVLEKGTDCCTDTPDEGELSNKYVCKSCLKEVNDEPNVANFAFCGLDNEKVYALHISDLKYYETSFYCKEHIQEFDMYDEEQEGCESYVEYLKKD